MQAFSAYIIEIRCYLKADILRDGPAWLIHYAVILCASYDGCISNEHIFIKHVAIIDFKSCK
jgi:hypothetical protein